MEYGSSGKIPPLSFYDLITLSRSRCDKKLQAWCVFGTHGKGSPLKKKQFKGRAGILVVQTYFSKTSGYSVYIFLLHLFWSKWLVVHRKNGLDLFSQRRNKRGNINLSVALQALVGLDNSRSWVHTAPSPTLMCPNEFPFLDVTAPEKDKLQSTMVL